MFVPVVDKENKPLMPTIPSRARRWIRLGKATPFWKKGIFCVRLNVEPLGRGTQKITVGIDPGSKKEAFSIKSKGHTYLNIQSNAVTWVKNVIKSRKEMRRARRFRKTPCRKPRFNRARGGLAPSTKARWQWKLRICWWLKKMYPITDFVVEDIKARTKKGKKKWNVSFSSLEVGKKWFYGELEKLGQVHLKQGFETKEERDKLGLVKLSDKLSNSFYSHCVDSWVLANWYVGGHRLPENIDILQVVPLRFHRRQLHKFQPDKGGIRSPYGGTRSLGFKRGAYIKHPKYGISFVSGRYGSHVTLRSIVDGRRLTMIAKPQDCKHLTFASFRTRR